ncbi:MAG: alpha/beta hydrolase [Methanobrevibacter sp.]|uniref:alpha/beta hydrolase n=1 Tax=Methanobrevibacter sp. TaxID=66852 RepID=UPI0025F2B930|nr:alpha/beta hydrolase [Methanobrevibacter sp.]MBQ6100168.1 alpha/beta hydrolase [Methanobrevibacter sp.]
MRKAFKIGIIAFIIIFVGGFFVYAGIYYHADETATDLMNGTENVSVVKVSNGLLLDGYGNDTAIIFYPGAKVEYTSYLPLFMDVASKGYDCYLVEMPFNLAFFNKNSADEILKNSSYNHYFIAGHSLGGAMASIYVNSTDRMEGIIYLASHSPNEIQIPALSIYGSNDGVMNMEHYQEAKPLMKNNYTELIINGGNHAQFGNYGNQSGDGAANITAESQQDQSVDAIIKFLENYT